MWHDVGHAHNVKFLEYFKFFWGKNIVRKYTKWLFTDGNLIKLGQIYFLKQSLEFHEKLRKIASSTTLKEQRIL